MISEDSPATSAGAGPTDETTIVPPPTTAAADLAWSIDDDLFPEATKMVSDEHGPSWRRTAALSIALLAVASLIAVSAWAFLRSEPIAARPVVVTTTTVINPPASSPAKTTTSDPATPPAAPDAPDLDANDRAFLQALQRDNVVIPNHAKALAGAHWVCNQYRDGATRADIVTILKNSNPELADLGATDFMAAAVIFYCPQYA